MNHYGAQAQLHWQTYLPERYARLEDPNSFFSTLGETAAQEITDRAQQLAGPDRPGEGYLGKLGRLNEAKLRAEEEILPELILVDPAAAPDDDLDEEPSSPQTSAQEWIPLAEDPTHPFWQEIAAEEADEADESGPPIR